MDTLTASYLADAANAMREYGYTQIIQTVIVTCFALIIFGMLIGCLSRIFKGSASERHRSTVTDLYVIGMIRKYAKEDGIDLANELRDLKYLVQLEKAEFRSLDKTIEASMKEKIINSTQDKLDSKKLKE